MLPPTAVVFDLDGTLIDSRGDIVAATNHALLSRGHAPLPGQAIVRYVGDGARSLCARCAQLDEGDPEVDALLALFLAYYTAHPVEFTRWMPGAQEVLETLASMDGLLLGLCTNKPRATTDAVLGALGVRERFQAIVAGGDIPEKKPEPEPLLRVAHLLDRPPSQIVMIGDGTQDVECARRAKMRVIAIESGFTSRKRLLEAKPDVLVTSLDDLPSILRRWQDATIRMPPR